MRLLATIVGVVCMLLQTSQSAAFTTAEAQCRLKSGTAYRGYGRNLAARAIKCHRFRMLDRLPPVVDCDDPSTWAANGFTRDVAGLEKAEARLRATVNSCRPEVTSPALLGHTTCPAPCGAVPLNTFDDLGECIFCLADGCIRSAIEDAFGVPPLPIETTPRKCQDRVGRDLVIYFNKLSKTEQVCQFRQERNKTGYVGIDCTDFSNPLHPLAPAIQRATEKMDKLIAKRCAGVDFVTQLDSCGNDIASEQACLRATVEQCADSLFEAAYPPAP